MPARTETALDRLAAHLRADPVIAPHLREPEHGPAFGDLVAAGPRAAEAPEEYAFLVEAIREGYLLHFRRPRLLGDGDADLLLLAGDYLYSLGLERLAARGDLEAVRELGDLISLSSQLYADAGEAGGPAAEALWVASSLAVAAGGSPDHERAKELLRAGETERGAEALLAAAAAEAERSGIGDALAATAEQVGFAIPERG